MKRARNERRFSERAQRARRRGSVVLPQPRKVPESIAGVAQSSRSKKYCADRAKFQATEKGAHPVGGTRPWCPAEETTTKRRLEAFTVARLLRVRGSRGVPQALSARYRALRGCLWLLRATRR